MEGEMKKEVFISYASKELKIAEEVCEYLERRGTTCWIAPRDILPGTEYGESIIDGIENSKAVVLIFSESSNSSQHVLREVERAVAKNVPIIAYKINDAAPCKSMEYFLLSNQWLDATTKGNHLEELHRSIISLASKQERKVVEEVPLKSLDIGSVLKKSTLLAFAIAGVALLLTGIIVLLIMNSKSDQDKQKVENLNITPTIVIENSFDENDSKDNVKLAEELTQAPIQQETSDQTSKEQQVPIEQKDSQPEQTQSDSAKPDHQQTPKEEVTKPPVANDEEVSASVLETVSIGDYITFGSYEPQGYSEANQDNKISWIVVDIDKKNNQAVLLTEKVVDMKPFDVAESGIFDKDSADNSYDRDMKDSFSMQQMQEFRGNSDWDTSNIRTWLNSDSARVSYKDQAPSKRATDECVNAYDLQSGFLYGFSEKEKAMIFEKNNVTAMNAVCAQEADKKAYGSVPTLITDEYNLKGSATKTTKDKVYLLSFDEVQKYLFNNNLIIFAEPTQSAIDSDKSTFYKVSLSHDTKYSTWALRTPNGASAHQFLAVSAGISAKEDIHVYYCAADGVGIRPAMTVSFDQVTLEGEGTKEIPFTLR